MATDVAFEPAVAQVFRGAQKPPDMVNRITEVPAVGVGQSIGSILYSTSRVERTPSNPTKQHLLDHKSGDNRQSPFRITA